MMNELQKLVDDEWQKKPDFRDTLLLTCIGLSSEVGEIQDNIKRFAYYGAEIDKENLLEEAGDVLHYLMACLSLNGFTMEQAAEHQLKKYKIRFPDGWSQEDAILKRDHGE